MTSEWGRRAAAITAVTVCMGFGAAPASAQLFPPPDPPDPGASGPSTTQLSPAGESFAFGANPSRTGESLENRLGGPMFRDWTRRFGSLTAQPLVVGGRVIVATGQADGGGSRVLALTARSGKTLWEQRWAQSGVDAPMAATDGIVLTIDTTAAVRAFSAESGELLWARDLGDSAAYGMSPTALDGRFYVHSNRGLAALRAADGQLIWQRSVSPSPAGIAADEKRLYIAGPCGEGAALSRSTGATMWYRTGGCSGGGGYNAIVADGRMFSTEGYTYDAITGQPRGRLRQLPAVVGNGAAFIYNNGLQAAELSDGTVRWTKRIAPLNGPVLASGTVFVNTEESVVGVDQATGAVLSKTKTGIEYPSDSYYYDGLAAGAGRLFLSFDGKLTALRPYLNPAANSGALFTQRIAVRVGKRMGLTGLVGTALKRRGLKVELLGGPAGRKGKLKRLDTAATRSDGSAKFKIKLKRNMRVSVRPKGGKASRPGNVYAYPVFRIRTKAVSRTRGVFTVKLKGVPGGFAAKRKVVAYIGRAKQGRMGRLGSGGLKRTGGKTSEAKVGFKLLQKVGRTDFIFVCVPGLAKAGWGVPDRVQRSCGDKRIRYEKRNKLSAPAPGSGLVVPSCGECLGAGLDATADAAALAVRHIREGLDTPRP
jgi:outer membrane protein assembly factor BamB